MARIPARRVHPSIIDQDVDRTVGRGRQLDQRGDLRSARRRSAPPAASAGRRDLARGLVQNIATAPSPATDVHPHELGQERDAPPDPGASPMTIAVFPVGVSPCRLLGFTADSRSRLGNATWPSG